MYKVALFNINATITISNEGVLPFQAMTLPQPLFDALISVMHTVNRQGLTLNVPLEGGVGALSNFTFEEAALPYALAVQAPIILAKRWSCTHAWTLRYTIPMDNPTATPVAFPKKKFQTPGLSGL